MASPSVIQRLTGASSARGTSFTATFSAATTGNLLVLEMACETNNAGPTGPPAGWTTGILNASNGSRVSIFYKIAAGGETSVTVTFGSNEWGWIFREISGGTTITFGAAAAATSSNPVPQTVTLTGAKDTLWIAGAAFKTNSVSSFSSGYSNGVTAASTGVNLERIASAEKQSNGSSETAGNLTLTASLAWVSFSYGVESLYSGIVGSSTLTFTQSAIIKGNTALVASSTLTFSQTATIKANGVLIGTGLLTFTPTGTIKANGALLGTGLLTFTPSATIKGIAPVIGSSILTFGNSSTLIGTGKVSGSSILNFTLTGTGALFSRIIGNSSLTFSQSGILQGSGKLLGSSTLVFTPSSTLIGTGKITGSSGLTFSPIGTIKGNTALIGNSALTFDQFGTIIGLGELSGIILLSLEASGTLTFYQIPYGSSTGPGYGDIFDTSNTAGVLFVVTTGDGYGDVFEEETGEGPWLYDETSGPGYGDNFEED